jgi:Flp pilus assembly pilin Flp
VLAWKGEPTVTKSPFYRFIREDEGQDLVEYALLITFIALACIVGMQQLGTAINNNYNSISQSLAS